MQILLCKTCRAYRSARTLLSVLSMFGMSYSGAKSSHQHFIAAPCQISFTNHRYQVASDVVGRNWKLCANRRPMQDFDGWMAGLDGGEFQSLSRHVLKHPYEVFHVVIDEHTAQSVARCEESLGCKWRSTEKSFGLSKYFRIWRFARFQASHMYKVLPFATWTNVSYILCSYEINVLQIKYRRTIKWWYCGLRSGFKLQVRVTSRVPSPKLYPYPLQDLEVRDILFFLVFICLGSLLRIFIIKKVNGEETRKISSKDLVNFLRVFTAILLTSPLCHDFKVDLIQKHNTRD